MKYTTHNLLRRGAAARVKFGLSGALAALAAIALAATLAGCGEKKQRTVYKNRQDCLDDWGGNEKDCQEPPPGSAHYRKACARGSKRAMRSPFITVT